MADLRVLVAPQEFKGTLTAVEAAEAIEAGLRRSHPGWTFDLLPMADGGPGTTDALIAALGGQRHTARASDPRRWPIVASWGLLPGKRVIVECAAASGLRHFRPDELTPDAVRRASSYGTGELILDALEYDIEELIVGLGGSATNDGGAGVGQALGARLLDDSGRELPPGGAALARLARIDVTGLNPRLPQAGIFAATDVFNPLCGARGASAVYGPQKGATPQMVQELDAALAHYAAIIERDLGVRVLDVEGAGAAGGLGAGLVAFLGAQVLPGAKLVAEAAGLEQRIAGADLVIAGEGRLDVQTGFGKAPWEVARLARAAGVPVVVIAGSVREDCGKEVLDAFDAVAPVLPAGVPTQQAMARGGELLSAAAEQLGRMLALGRRLAHSRPDGGRDS